VIVHCRYRAALSPALRSASLNLPLTTPTASLSLAIPQVLWSRILQLVESYENDIPVDAFAHVLHGFGHGAMFIGSAFDDEENYEILMQGDPCGSEGDYEKSVHFSKGALLRGIDICGYGKGPEVATMEEQYMCGSGLYMSYWTALNMKGYFEAFEGMDFVHTCASYPWPAGCYRWTFRYASRAQVESLWEDDPCDSAPDSSFDSNIQRRGCIWGFATNHYIPYDLAMHITNDKVGGDSDDLHTLVDFCGKYVYDGKESKDRLRKDVWKEEWLTCIAASMEAIAFDGIANSVKGTIEFFCDQLLAYKVNTYVGEEIAGVGRQVCVETATANIANKGEMYMKDYKPRIAETDDLIKCKRDFRNCLHGWRTDILED